MGREFGQDNEEEQYSGGESRRKPLLVVLGATCIIILVIVLSVSIPGRKRQQQNGSNSGGSSNNNNNNNNVDFHSILPEYTKIELKDKTSPQSLALYWLQIDPSYNTYTNERRLTRFALATLFYATNGETAWKNNTNWLSFEVHECDWYTTLPPDSHHNLCQELELQNNGLDGTLPKEIGLLGGKLGFSNGLEHLNRIDLSRNPQLRGTIPVQLGYLSRIKSMYLGSNSLTGTIPPSLFTTDHLLETLHLHGNQLTGYLQRVLPSHLQDCNIKVLNMNHNQLTGPIPAVFRELTQLEVLQLNNNNLTETIPSTLGTLSHLRTLHLQNNEFLSVDSPIPIEVCSLFTEGSLLDLTIDCTTIPCSCNCTCA